jgi:pyruvate dehydrogenase E2 component (dihydrolipoamide acetyltransferase)
MADVTMPQLGETVTEGTITRWTKAVGDTVAVDEVLFEVSTDKVDSEVPSPAAGTIVEILVAEGETADVGAVLAKIGDAGAAPASGGGNDAASAPAPEPAPETTNTTAQATQQEDAALNPPATAPRDEAPAAAAFPPVSQPAAAPAASSNGGGDGKVLSPVVRKLINENGLDPARINGTGAGGRITREDVEKLIGGGTPSAPQTQAAPVAASAASAPSAPRGAAPAPLPPAKAGERDTVVPFTKIRQRTAEHMIMSKATSAHTLVTIEVDYANVDKVRKAKKEQFKQEEGTSLTYLPFISRAVVDALREFPYANASVGTNELVVHRDVNLGIAVDLDYEGLLVPVLKNADGLRLRQLGRGIADIAYRARNKKLQADDITGGTFTITNAGGYGTFITYPVINQPQVAILSTDGVKKRPVVIELPDGTDAIVAHPVGMLGLAWDHRAFDGAYASAFLAKIKEVLETRNWSEEF